MTDKAVNEEDFVTIGRKWFERLEAQERRLKWIKAQQMSAREGAMREVRFCWGADHTMEEAIDMAIYSRQQAKAIPLPDYSVEKEFSPK